MKHNAIPSMKPDRESDPVAIQIHGLAALGDERWQDAIDIFQRMLDVTPDAENRRNTCLNISACYRALERFDEAQAVLDQAEQWTPNHPDIGFARATVLASAGRLPEAITALKRLVPGRLRRPRHPEAPQFLKDLQELHRSGRSPRTAHVDLLQEQIQTNTEMGDMDRVEAKARRMIELDPSRPEGHFSLGNALNEQGQYEAALAAFMAAHALDPENPPTLYDIGYTLVKLDRPEEAIPWLERTLDQDREMSGAYLYLGIANEQLGHRQRAISWWRQALKINPDYYPAQYHLHEVNAGPPPQEPPLSPQSQQFRRMVPLAKARMKRRRVTRNGAVTLTWDPDVGYVLEDTENPRNFSIYTGGPFVVATIADEDVPDLMGAVKMILIQVNASNTRDVAVLIYYPDGSTFTYSAQFDGEKMTDFQTDGRFDVTTVPRLFKVRMDSDLNTSLGNPMHGVLIYIHQPNQPGILTSTLGLLAKD